MTFDDLSVRTGIALPALLRQLIAHAPQALGSTYDFEWLSAAEAASVLDEWLDAKWQSGQRFLPFAQSGAGDAYCLVPLAGDAVGVAFVWHDAEESRTDHGSFTDFVCAKFLESFADLSHLEDDDLSEEEMAARVIDDVASVAAFMDAETAAWLQALSRRPVESRPFKAGPRAQPEQVPSLISQAQREEELARFQLQGAKPFAVKPRWEIGE
ncbi:SMI1/KNR4 family protein [Variovorax sp. RB3P1]|uniref:SMI1/KNR4 family protein n=1 Tax=Variovorax sp. RB3P1 TaxID=3443732 RepID=UPI003F45E1CE